MGNLSVFSVKVDLKVRFGEVNLRMVAHGEEYAPIVTLTEHRDKLDAKANDLHDCRAFPGHCLRFRNEFGLDALQMMVAPVTFPAIISGITNMSDAVDIGKVGSQLVFTSVIMLALVTLYGLDFSFLVLSGDLSYLQSAIQTGTEEAASQYGSLKDMIFGIVLNLMGEKARGATETLDFLFKFTVSVLKIILKAIPLIVFLSMAALLANTDIDSILTFSRLFIGLAVGIIFVWLVNGLATLLVGKILPIKFIKKLISYAPMPFTVSSSGARLPFDLQFCTDKLGIDPKNVSFLVSVGIKLNKTGQGVYFSPVIMSMRNRQFLAAG